jgi:predicted DNA repair protein MutK
MSGLLALLDDVAGIAKAAAASIDDVTAQALKASSKAAGVVIDDAAVTPKYVTGLAPARELPIIWKITRGSIFNKLVILLPLALLLSAFAPWAITPLLMLGGCYLCYEGAEKVLHWLYPHAQEGEDDAAEDLSPEHLEEARVRGAIKTDFILSAEIMTIILNEMPGDTSFAFRAVALAIAGLAITAAVYGSVAVIVKMDDLGLRMVERGRSALTRRLGLALVQGMPGFLAGLAIVGTLAMLWVGGAIVLHGLEVTHLWAAPYEWIHDVAKAAGESVERAKGFVAWFVQAVIDGLFGLVLGLGLIWAIEWVAKPFAATFRRLLRL